MNNKSAKARSKILTGGILLVVSVLLFTTILAVAQTQEELNQLEQELTDADYSGLMK